MDWYTLGIKRKWWFGFKKYRIRDNYIESQWSGVKIDPRMVLKLVDGSEVSIPGVEKKVIKIYPDYLKFCDEMAEQKVPEHEISAPRFQLIQDQSELVQQYKAELDRIRSGGVQADQSDQYQYARG